MDWGRVMFTVSKETTSSSVSHSLANGEMTPGSLQFLKS
jgi:hypothetical protein